MLQVGKFMASMIIFEMVHSMSVATESVNIYKVGTFISYCLVLVLRLQFNNVFFKD